MASSKLDTDNVRSIINRLGMDPERETDSDTGQREYANSMKKRYGNKGLRFMKHMDRRSESLGDFDAVYARQAYRLKNSDWRMSLQVSKHSEAEKHAAFIGWLCEADLGSPTRAGEIGCDIGIQACAMKLLWPSCHVTGFDQVNEAVLAAEYHAKWHSLRAIDFERLDLRLEPPQCHVESFDLVICPSCLHEIVPSTDIRIDELQEEWRRHPGLEPTQVIESLTGSVRLGEYEKQALKNLSALVAPGGHLVSVDRMNYGALQQRPIIRELANHGLEQIESDQITVESANGTEQFPIFVLRKAI